MSGRNHTACPAELEAALREARARKDRPSEVFVKIRAGTFVDGLGPIEVSDRTLWYWWRKALEAISHEPKDDPLPEGLNPTRLRLMVMASPELDCSEINDFCEGRGIPCTPIVREFIETEIAKLAPANPAPEADPLPATMGSELRRAPAPGRSLYPYEVKDKLKRALVNGDRSAVDALARAEREREDGGRPEILELIERFAFVMAPRNADRAVSV